MAVLDLTLIYIQRMTGYNGSDLWQAIYEENCFIRAGGSPLNLRLIYIGTLRDLCYEERVLYRLLSGMHTSINIHISLNYFPKGNK